MFSMSILFKWATVVLSSVAMAITFASHASAAGERYVLSGNELSVSGGNMRTITGSNSAIRLQTAPGENNLFRNDQLAVSASICLDEVGRIEVGINRSSQTVSGVTFSCYDAGRIGDDYNSLTNWSTGGYTTSNPEATPGSPEDNDRVDNTLANFRFTNSTGTVIAACQNIFYQFDDDGCINLTPLATGDRTTLTYQATVPARMSGCTGERNSIFQITLTEPRTVNNDRLPAEIRTTQRSVCPGMTYGIYGGTTATNINVTNAGQLTELQGNSVESEAATESAPTCQITHGLGWILCPMMNTLAAINDGAFWMLSKLLISPPLMILTDDGEQTGAYRAWVVMRNLANLALILVFLAIVFSQITNAGISNYGVKKMLPKLVIGAILINTSFFFVALAVDISNLMGRNIYSIMEGIVGTMGTEPGGEYTAGMVPPSTPLWQYVVGSLLLGQATIAGATVAAAAVIMAGLSVLLPLLVGAVVLVGGLVLALVFRNALVIILSILAPLALIAYLLPNMGGMAKTWWTMFKAVLLLFPAVALAMGGSKVAANIIWQEASENNDWIMMVIATAMPAMGIIFGLVVAKTMGSVMQRFGIKNPLGGVINAAKDGARKYGERQDNRNATAYLTGEGPRWRRAMGTGSRRRAKGKAQDEAAKRNLANAESRYTADQVLNSDGKFADKLSTGMGDSGRQAAVAQAVQVEAQVRTDEIKAQHALIEHADLSEAQNDRLQRGESFTTLDKNGREITLDASGHAGEALRIAARQNTLNSGDAERINGALDHLNGFSKDHPGESRELSDAARTLASASNRPAYIQAGDLERIGQKSAGEDISASTLMTRAVQDNVYSPEKMAATGKQEMSIVVDHVISMPVTDRHREAFRDNAQAVLADDELRRRVAKQMNAIVDAASL